MNEKVEMLYSKYGKLNLNINEMSKEIGISASKANKIFFEIGEKEIMKNKLLPAWRKVGRRRLWSLDAIMKWLDDTEIIST